MCESIDNAVIPSVRILAGTPYSRDAIENEVHIICRRQAAADRTHVDREQKAIAATRQ